MARLAFRDDLMEHPNIRRAGAHRNLMPKSSEPRPEHRLHSSVRRLMTVPEIDDLVQQRNADTNQWHVTAELPPPCRRRS